MKKPLLAHTIEDMAKIVFPVLASPKLDGIRALTAKDAVYSRNHKQIPNAFIQGRLIDVPSGLDGELIVGKPGGSDVFQRSTSGVMSRDGQPDFTLWVFDVWGCEDDLPFSERYQMAKQVVQRLGSKHVKLVGHKLISNLGQLEEYEAQMLLAGYEGIMVRGPLGVYKQGRSTMREGILGKVKRFCDAEATIIDFYEQERNGNELTKDELGRAKRSSHKANKTGKGVLGGVVVRDTMTGIEFQIGTGFDDASRAELWAGRDSLKGLIVKYKYQPTGVKEKPRFPVFLGFRDKDDI